MNQSSEIAIDPKNRISWEDWMKTRYRRRLISRSVAPDGLRRTEGSDDARLREAFDGERGPDFPSDEALREIAVRLGGPLEI